MDNEKRKRNREEEKEHKEIEDEESCALFFWLYCHTCLQFHFISLIVS